MLARRSKIRSDNEIEELAGQPTAFWKRTSATALADIIGRAKARIEFHLGTHHEFVVALARVKRAIPVRGWLRILDRLEPGNSTSCASRPDWEPRVLGNGGLAIRNFHRVLGIDLAHGVSVSGAKPAQIRREVRTVLLRAARRGNPS
jgi:hypothetical protein